MQIYIINRDLKAKILITLLSHQRRAIEHGSLHEADNIQKSLSLYATEQYLPTSNRQVSARWRKNHLSKIKYKMSSI